MRPRRKRYLLALLLFFICILSTARFIDQFQIIENNFSGNVTNNIYNRGSYQSASTKPSVVQNKVLHWMNFASPDDPKIVCEQRRIVGRLFVNTTPPVLSSLETEFTNVNTGGWWYPKYCNGYTSTAIIIPYRNRFQHLLIFLRQIVPILQRQNLHYRIFVIEQNDQKGFNRGKLLNIGFNEALRLFPYACVVFHDVDLIPEDDRIDYGCVKSPMHLSSAVSSFDYRLPYGYLFGGVEMLTPRHFRKVNGFSNLFYSWGGEDDDFSRRVRFSGFSIQRLSQDIARYTMLQHISTSVQRTADQVERTVQLLNVSQAHWKEDGLNSLQYQVNKIIEYKLYTLIQVNLLLDKEESFGVELT